LVLVFYDYDLLKKKKYQLMTIHCYITVTDIPVLFLTIFWQLLESQTTCQTQILCHLQYTSIHISVKLKGTSCKHHEGNESICFLFYRVIFMWLWKKIDHLVCSTMVDKNKKKIRWVWCLLPTISLPILSRSYENDSIVPV